MEPSAVRVMPNMFNVVIVTSAAIAVIISEPGVKNVAKVRAIAAVEPSFPTRNAAPAIKPTGLEM